MKTFRIHAESLRWIIVSTILAMVLGAGLHTNLTLRSVERTLPVTLLAQLEDLTQILEGLTEVVALSGLIANDPEKNAAENLIRKIDDVYSELVTLRNTYVFDNLVQASAFHSVVAPALVDAREWLANGVSGYSPDSSLTMTIAHSRLKRAMLKASAVRYESHSTAKSTLEEQRNRLERFLFSVNLLLLMTLLLSMTVLGLMLRQRRLFHLEVTARLESQRLTRIIESTNDLVSMFTPDGKLTFLNAAGRRLTGWNNDKTIASKSIKDLHPARVVDAIQETGIPLAVDNGIWSGEATVLDHKGLEIPVSSIIMSHKTPEGQVEYFSIIMRDISERKRAEIEREKLQAKLAQAQKMESIGILAGGIAHNFNNILMGVQGRASLMMMDKGPSSPDYEHLKGIKEYVKGATELTRDLLGFARGGKYEVKPTDMNALIKHESRMFGRTKKEIRVQGKYEKDLWTVEVDPGQMRQALLNLYVNAWQAMPGGGDLYVQTENVALDQESVKPFAINPGRYVKISVTDTGIGMDDVTREKIFDPFFSTKDTGQGSGLGLASVYGIIKNHGGFINVYSEKGTGTTFTIYLPASEKEAEEQGPIADQQGIQYGRGTVLLVDDEDMIVDVGKEMLERLGYRVLVARSGEEALDVYGKQKEEIDLVILDMIMPGMGGGEVFDRLKDTDRNVKVLLSSGYSVNGQAKEIMDRGCGGFLQKPFAMEELSRKVKDVFDR